MCYDYHAPRWANCLNCASLFTGLAFLFYAGPMIVLLRVPDIIDDEASSDELDELCDYIEGRLRLGISDRRVFQSLMEAVLSFDGEGMDMTQHVLH